SSAPRAADTACTRKSRSEGASPRPVGATAPNPRRTLRERRARRARRAIGVSSSNWLEHPTPNPGVAGSNPAWPVAIRERGRAGQGRAPAGARGGQQESHQSMEQHSTNKQPQTRLREVVDFVPRSIEFVKESWAELKKVHWPSRKETYSATVIVVIV